MSADARIWCAEDDTESWTGWVDGSDRRPTGDLLKVIVELEWACGHILHWMPVQCSDGPAISGYIVPLQLPTGGPVMPNPSERSPNQAEIDRRIRELQRRQAEQAGAGEEVVTTEDVIKPMTGEELSMILMDEFHDWTDGDDWPDWNGGDPIDIYRAADKHIMTVLFASGNAFTITVEPA